MVWLALLDESWWLLKSLNYSWVVFNYCYLFTLFLKPKLWNIKVYFQFCSIELDMSHGLNVHVRALGLDKFLACLFWSDFWSVFAFSYKSTICVRLVLFLFMCCHSTYWSVSQILHCIWMPQGVQGSNHVLCKLFPSSHKMTHQEWDWSQIYTVMCVLSRLTCLC